MPGQQICDPLSPTYNQAMCDQLTGGGGQLPDIPTAPPQPEAKPYEVGFVFNFIELIAHYMKF